MGDRAGPPDWLVRCGSWEGSPAGRPSIEQLGSTENLRLLDQSTNEEWLGFAWINVAPMHRLEP